MLAHGQQFIVDGIHPDTERPYSWHAGRTLWNTPRPDLPEINEAEAQSLVSLIVEMLVERFGFQIDTGTDMEDGHTNGGTGAVYDSDGRLDVEASLAAMQPSGASVNDIQPKVILSLLQRAIPPTEVIDTVVDATMDMATRNGLPWTREVEVKCVDRRVDCDLKKLQDEYDYRTGEIPRWLAEEFHQKWADTLAKGGRPRLSRNRHNKHLFSVWAYGADKEEPAERRRTRTGRSPRRSPRQCSGSGSCHSGTCGPGVEPLYLIDELIPVTGSGGHLGQAEVLQVVRHPRHDAACQPWAGNITTAASAKVRLSIARSRAHTATRSGSRRCGGTTRSPRSPMSRSTSCRGKPT